MQILRVRGRGFKCKFKTEKRVKTSRSSNWVQSYSPRSFWSDRCPISTSRPFLEYSSESLLHFIQEYLEETISFELKMLLSVHININNFVLKRFYVMEFVLGQLYYCRHNHHVCHIRYVYLRRLLCFVFDFFQCWLDYSQIQTFWLNHVF